MVSRVRIGLYEWSLWALAERGRRRAWYWPWGMRAGGRWAYQERPIDPEEEVRVWALDLLVCT